MTMEKTKGTEPKFWIYAVAAALLSACFTIWFWWDDIWYWLKMVDEGESNGATLRNAALTVAAGLGSVAGLVGIGLAIWRNRTADKQTGIANKQADTAERGLNNERYQRGAEMLGNAQLATRLGGISALSRLAREHPKEYHIQIMNLIVVFVRHPTEDKALDGNEDPPGEEGGGGGTGTRPNCRPDVEEAVRRAVGGRTQEQLKVEQNEGYHINLTSANLSHAYLLGAHLSGVYLHGANFSNATLVLADLTDAGLHGADLRHAYLMDASIYDADLTDADLSHANLFAADLTGANLTDADLRRSNLRLADLSGATLSHADLSSAYLTGTKNLTQDQLDVACQFPDGEPPQTPERLSWDEEAAKKRWRERHEAE